MKLFSWLILMFAGFFFYGNANGQCESFPKWQDLMDKGQYAEAFKVAYALRDPANNSKKAEKEKDAFMDKYRNSLCFEYFRAEAAYKMGDLSLAFAHFKGVKLNTKDYTGRQLMDRYIHHAIELGEKDFAANKLDSALEALEWAASRLTAGGFTCTGYPKAGVDHVFYLAELLGDVSVKKGNYEKAITYYQIVDKQMPTPQISEKIALAKESQQKQQKELIAQAKQKDIQDKKDAEAREIAEKKRAEDLAKQKTISDEEAKKRKQQEESDDKQRTVRMYGDGNTSVKINDSANYLSNAERRTWLENSALAFSENNKELYFRHPTENYYQVWSVATKEKLSEIPFVEAGNTPKGREIIAAFPNIPYRADTYANSKIWLSADLSITFDDHDNFRIFAGENQPEKSFTLNLLKNLDADIVKRFKNWLRKSEVVNTRYQLYFCKKINKLFIIASADLKYESEKKYFSSPYCGVFSFDLAGNTLNALLGDPCAFADTRDFSDRWYFFSDNLVHKYVEDKKSLFKKFGLATVTAQDLKYATTRLKYGGKEEPNGWRNPFAGIDLQDNLYLVNPANNHIVIYYFNKSNEPKGEFVKILNSTNRHNEVQYDKEQSTFVDEPGHTEIKNVLAVSPSGKFFAYLSLNTRAAVGNYASIMMYNVDEKDRVYTLNDQKKYQPYIAKGYVTDQESEALTLVWKKDREAAEAIKKQKEEVAKQERETRYRPQINALKVKLLEMKKELDAYLKPELDLYALGDYKTVLVRNKWTASDIYKPYGNGRSETYYYAYEDMEFRFNTSGVYAMIKERLRFPASKKTQDHLLLTGDPGFNDNRIDGVVKGTQYITSSCDANLLDWQSNEFNLRQERYFGCQIHGLEVLDDGPEFKTFGDTYLNFLMNAKFKLVLLPNNTFLLEAWGTNGIKMAFKIPETSQQMILDGKLADLRKEITKIETMIETGN